MSQQALITGASTGIGFELALLFAADKYDLILVGRDRHRLNQAADKIKQNHKVKISLFPQDLSESDGAHRLFEAIKKENLEINVLVNNAGFGLTGPFSSLNLKEQEEMMVLNMQSLTTLTYLCLQEMVSRKSGSILNVGSTASFVPGPYMAVYYATKAYVLSFSEALREEVQDFNIKVSCLCPGATDTPFKVRSGMKNSLLFKAGTSRADEVAKKGYQALKKNQAVCIPGLKHMFLMQSIRFAPRWLVRKVTKLLQQTRV